MHSCQQISRVVSYSAVNGRRIATDHQEVFGQKVILGLIKKFVEIDPFENFQMAAAGGVAHGDAMLFAIGSRMAKSCGHVADGGIIDDLSWFTITFDEMILFCVRHFGISGQVFLPLIVVIATDQIDGVAF